MSNRDSFISKISGLSASLGRFFSSCAFDKMKNLIGAVEPDDFWSFLFYPPPQYDDLSSEIHSRFKHPVSPRSIFVLTGYAGTGKTTFLQYFINRDDDVIHVYINIDDPLVRKPRVGPTADERALLQMSIAGHKGYDFDELAGLLSRLVDPDSPICSLLRADLLLPEKEASLGAAIIRMKRNLDSVQRYISYDFGLLLSTIPHALDSRVLSLLVRACPAGDILLLFMMSVIESTRGADLVYIYFDNIDKIELEYLSKAFCDDFYMALERVNRICSDGELYRNPFEYNDKYKFLFCLREANFATIDVQFHSYFRHISFVKRFAHFAEGDLYPNIARTRLDIAKEIYSDNPDALAAIGHALEMLNIFIPSTQEFSNASGMGTHGESVIMSSRSEYKESMYFNAAISPLFNFDLKKLLPVLINSSERVIPDKENRLVPKDEDHLRQFLASAKYGKGGNLVYAISDYLKRDEFAQHIFIDPGSGTTDPTRGHCLRSRMILTLCTNLITYDHIRHIVVDNEGCNVAGIIDSLAGMYTPREIVGKIEELFLAHRQDWVHLLSIDGLRILKKGDIISDDDEPRLDRMGIVRDRSGRVRADIPGLLRRNFCDMRVRIAPAGYAFLRYINTHFEFYSNFTINKRPLFVCGVNKVADDRYEFEDVVDNVYSLVAEHVKSMGLFYEEVIRGGLGVSPGEYKRSNLCFKYVGRIEEDKRHEGYFHAFRLINVNIIHIDQFRSYLLSSDIDEDMKSDVNRRLADCIMRFARLHRYCADPASKEFLAIYEGLYRNLEETEFTSYYLSLFTSKKA